MSSLLSQRSDLPFKGSRDYLHGTDTYNWLASLIPAESTFSITFRRLIRRQMEITNLAGDPRAVAEFAVNATDRYTLIETDAEPTARIPYDEDALTTPCTIDAASITAPLADSPCTPIELCVAMTKALHHAAMPEEKRKWLFARLELNRLFLPADKFGLRIEIVQRVETRFTKSTITTRDGVVGNIYFSVIP